jgi:hypothetical protein
MKLLKLFFAFTIVAGLLYGCAGNKEKKTSENNPQQTPGKEFKDGENSIFDKDGNLQYIVEYKNGKPNGRVRQFFADGKLYMDATYKNGFRDGKCTYFFKNGNPFTVSNYENGNKEGIETKYYQDGKILSVNTFKKNNVLPGLIEYDKDGNEIKNKVSLIIKKSETPVNGKYYIHLRLSDPGIDAAYYAAIPAESDKKVKLKMSGNDAVFEIPQTEGGSVAKKIVFDALYLTPKGNERRLQETYNFFPGK